MMHEPQRSGSAIVATKPANEAGRSAAEQVERRAGTGRNVDQQTRAGLGTGEACHRRWTRATSCNHSRLVATDSW